MRNGEDYAHWMIVPTTGVTPGCRYGHSLVYFKPYIILFGGNNGVETLGDAWLLNIDSSPFAWMRLSTDGDTPPARTYHSASLCTSGCATGMMVIFGGRSADQTLLNDAWGLRKHRDGRWDWVVAPVRASTEPPLKRYQHCSLFLGTLLFVVGGRTEQASEIGLEVYDTETSDWLKLAARKRFRHAAWTVGTQLFTYGGLEDEMASMPTDKLTKIDLEQLFMSNKPMLGKIMGEREDQFVSEKAPGTPTLAGSSFSSVKPLMPMPNKRRTAAESAVGAAKGKQPSKTFKLASIAVLAVPPSSLDPSGRTLKTINLDALPEDSKSIFSYLPNPKMLRQTDSIHSVFIAELLRPKDWKTQQNPNGTFNFRKEFIIDLADQCIKVVRQQPIVLRVRAPVKIFGDVHGQYQDLMRFFDLWGTPSDDLSGDIEAYDYLFLGDYVDRGLHSLETVCLLMALKVKYPEQVHLLRGNHEDRWINNVFGFAEECALRLEEEHTDPKSAFNKINDLFDYLPLAAVIEDKILCLHGGIGSTLDLVARIETLKRPLEVVHDVQTEQQQLVVDILWSDPTDTDQDFGIRANYIRDPNSTGNIVKYGPDKVYEFLARNNLLMILRAHECVMDGFERFAGGTLITVFSATDYCGRHKNAGAVLFITRKFEIIPKLIYPIDNGDGNWMMEGEVGKEKRPPTPPRWVPPQFSRTDSFN